MAATPQDDLEQELVRGRYSHLGPWLVLVVALLATAWSWSVAQDAVERRTREQFDYRVEEIISAIHNRLAAYEQILRSGVALFVAEGGVGRDQWRTFVEHLEIEEQYPGILGVGYAQVLRPEQLAQHQANLRAQGYSDYRVWPAGPRSEFSAIVFLEPFHWRNQRALGYDMLSEPKRRAAMLRARDTGEPAASAKVTLVQETGQDVQPGFLVYLPLYRGGGLPATVEERRERLLGYVYSPFRMKDLMHGIFGIRPPDVEMRIYDGTEAGPESLLFASGEGDFDADAPRATHRLATYGRPWTVEFVALPHLSAGARPTVTLWVGLFASLSLFALTWSMASLRARALRLARRMTASTRERTAQLREITSSIGEGVLVTDQESRITFVNPAAEELLGWSAPELLGMNAAALLHEHVAKGTSPASCELCRYAQRGEAYRTDEQYFRRKDGSRVPVSVIATPVVRETGVAGSVIAFHDISERKEVEAALRRSEQFRALFEYSREAWFLLEVDGSLVDVNPVACELLGYGRHALKGAHLSKLAQRDDDTQLDFVDIYRKLLSGGSLLIQETYVRSDGTRFPVEALYSLVEHESRRLFLVAARDVTERRRAEQQLNEAMEALEQARRETEHVNEQLAQSNLELLRLAQLDGLTGIANRRYFDSYLDNEWRRAARNGHSLGLLLIDVDHFKAYNDLYGHQAGDDCLRRVTSALAAQLSRAGDLLARYGGEEFALILPETTLESAGQLAALLNRSVTALQIPHSASPTAPHVTISLGVAVVHASKDANPASLVEQADRALYQAKAEGRDRVFVSPGDDTFQAAPLPHYGA